MKKDKKWVYEHLVCEFDHWDFCLAGLVKVDEKYFYCKFLGDKTKTYEILPINWTEECQEYLDDYAVAYKHWFYVDGHRTESYNHWDLSWFSEKWGHRSPIEESVIR